VFPAALQALGTRGCYAACQGMEMWCTDAQEPVAVLVLSRAARWAGVSGAACACCWIAACIKAQTACAKLLCTCAIRYESGRHR
jgi:hypothetical protein